MRKEYFGYLVVFIAIVVSAVAFVVPGVESAPLSDEQMQAHFGSSSRVAEGIDLEQELLPQIQRSFLQTEQQNSNSDGDQVAETLEKIEELYRFIESNFIYEIDHEVMYKHLVESLFSALDDPYSSYIFEDDASRITDTTTGVYGGIGAYISKPDPAHRDSDDPSSYMVTIVSPFQGSPAHRAGLHAGDMISHINGEDVSKLTAEDASRKLRGEVGTDVTVTVYRSEDVSYEVTITREEVTVPTVEYDMIDEIGYLKILQFTPVTPEKVMEAIEHFREHDYESVIIDVRQNPGGEFSAVRQIADFFLDSGVIVSTESRVPNQSRVFRAAPRTEVPSDKSVVVLVNEGSASGSEILAGALQDNERAAVIGANTFGKGYVQGVFPFEQDYFKITISKYLTPLEQDIEKHGITPDIISESEKLSDDESKAANELLISEKLSDFVLEHPEKDAAPIDGFIEDLQDDFELSERYIRMMLMDEYYRRMDFPPVYNLEYDETLKRALEELR